MMERDSMSSKVSNLTKQRLKSYPVWFALPLGIIFIGLFILPTATSFYYAMMRWSLFGTEYVGFENYAMFFQDPFLMGGLKNTLIYALLTSGAKVVIGLLLGVLLTSNAKFKSLLRSIVFFPVLVSTIGVGLTFQMLMKPDLGLIDKVLNFFGIYEAQLLGNPDTALLAVAAVDIWKGVGLATVIYIAGIATIPTDYYEAARMDGATSLQNFRHVTLPLLQTATNTVIILSLIGGLRSFDLIWAMTGGGPGFASDVLASLIYKNYQSGFFGLSTAGNVIMFLAIAVLIFPLSRFLTKREVTY
jgi:raffinose/stachyose/melibiose transport system permease protein